jgi:hypothetical protein
LSRINKREDFDPVIQHDNALAETLEANAYESLLKVLSAFLKVLSVFLYE